MKIAKLTCIVFCICLVLSATTFSGHYKKKPPANCTSIDPGDFVLPPITILRPQTGDSCLKIAGAEVWVRCKLDKTGKAAQSEVVWCSVDDTTFEITSLDVVNTAQFDGEWRGYHGKDAWLYHVVLFRHQDEHKCEVHWDRPVKGNMPKITRQPEMIDQCQPAYPRMALANNAEGSVWVKALVSPFGEVAEALVGKSSGDRYLDNSALLASYRNKYKPALSNATPTAVWVMYRVDFKITN